MRIEIIGILDDKQYSIGKISVSKKGDAYVIPKFNGLKFHASRHVSGKFHWKFSRPNFYQHIWNSTPLDKFKGIEQIGCWGYTSINSAKFSRHHHEYKIKNQDRICEITLRDYQEGFNLMIFMLTREGKSNLNIISNMLTNPQIYLYEDFFPMIGVMVGIPKNQNPSV